MKTKCNICSSTRSEKLFNSQNIHGRFVLNKLDTFTVYKCLDCKNIFLANLVLDKKYYKKYYQDDYYTVDLGNAFLNFIIKTMDKFSFSLKERLILSNYQSDKILNIMDIGCGIGMFLNHLNGKKFNKYGLEINKKGADIARKKGITVYNSDILKIKLKKKFDVITMWHVLEHISEPQKVFAKVNSLLNKGGLFVFAVPNSECLGFNLGKKYWYHLDSPRHVFIPNKSTVKLLLKKNRFKLIKTVYEFYDYPIDLLVSVKNSLIRYLVYSLYPLFKFFDQETLTFIAQKES